MILVVQPKFSAKKSVNLFEKKKKRCLLCFRFKRLLFFL